jgi:hypothetical protein
MNNFRTKIYGQDVKQIFGNANITVRVTPYTTKQLVWNRSSDGTEMVFVESAVMRKKV